MTLKVKVIHEFTDRYTKELYRIGDTLDLPVKRVNEIVRVGGLIEIVEVEQEEETVEEVSVDVEQTEQTEQSEPVKEEEPKATGRRKRSK
nr:MAG TPA: hypothetical protein [Caudoviricetes sp.]